MIKPPPIIHQKAPHWTIEHYPSIDLVIMTHPNRDQDDPGYPFLWEFISTLEDPWRYNAIFNMLDWPGVTPFAIVQEFADRFNELMGGRDVGKRSCTVDNNPVTQSRYATSSFQNLFPNRQLQLFDNLDDAFLWATHQT